MVWVRWLLLLLAFPLLRGTAERAEEDRTELEVEDYPVDGGEGGLNLEPDGDVASAALHESTAERYVGSVLQVKEAATAQSKTAAIGGAAAQMVYCAAIFAAVAIAYKMTTAACASRKCDCRRWKPISQALLSWGWDEFETFEALVSIHSLQDVQNDKLFGGKSTFKVKVNFNWSNAETSGTKDMRWEQTKKLEIPQGAAEGVLSLYSLGTIRDSRVGTLRLDTKKDMLDKAEKFFGVKQKLKMEHKGKTVGTLLATFRKKGSKDFELGECAVEGVDEDSALRIDIDAAIEEAVKKKEMLPLKPGEKLTGERKVAILAKTLQGDLREIELKDSSEKGKVFVRGLYCNFAELKGDDMKEEYKKQLEKAAKKGLKEVQKKWYFAWYGSKNDALDPQKWHFPDGFFPLATITSVHRSPERQDQFLLKYTAGSKETLVFRREQGKSLDSWVDALDLANQELRDSMKGEKEAEDLADKEKAKARVMHQQWTEKHGMPGNEQQWTAWFQWMKSGNLEDESIRLFYQELVPNLATARPVTKAAAKPYFKKQ